MDLIESIDSPVNQKLKIFDKTKIDQFLRHISLPFLHIWVLKKKDFHGCMDLGSNQITTQIELGKY